MPTGIYVRTPKPLEDPIPRFWKYVNKTEGCWLWTADTRKGYGRFWFDGHSVPAQRFIFEQLHGKQPSHIHICHKCDVPLCVRPDHLFAGTVTDNVQDAIRKGRWNYSKRESEKYVRGENNHKAKMTEETVRELRSLEGQLSHQALARKFGITKYAAFSILRRLTWKHVL